MNTSMPCSRLSPEFLTDESIAQLRRLAEDRLSDALGKLVELSVTDGSPAGWDTMHATRDDAARWHAVKWAAIECQSWRNGQKARDAAEVAPLEIVEGTTADDDLPRMGEIHEGSTLLSDHRMGDTCEGTPVGVEVKP